MRSAFSRNVDLESLRRDCSSMAPAHPPAILRITTGPDAGLTCELRADSAVLVGRGAMCDLRLTDPGVSRVHCRAVADGDGVRLEDADSRYGTLINDRPVGAAQLHWGDRILIGDSELRVEEVGTACPPPQDIASSASEWFPEESITFAAEQSAVRPGPASRPADLVGCQYVRFRVEHLMARTPSGVVYRARDTIHDRPVALKVYWPGLFTGDTAMSRFLRSMRATIRLQHNRLIKLHAAGRSEGLCFTASEFVDGESAADLIERIGIAGMLDWRTTWRIAVGVAEALEYLHENQILHRSLHPANMLIRAADGCVKLGDSLLAKSLGELEQPALTACGDVAGDIFYSSPEQLQHGTPVDCRSDLYSLGAALYALLTGRPPFTGSPAEVIRGISSHLPEPPKQRHLSIPAAFEGVVLRLLARRPEERFQTAASLLAELSRVGSYEGLATSSTPAPEEGRDRRRSG